MTHKQKSSLYHAGGRQTESPRNSVNSVLRVCILVGVFLLPFICLYVSSQFFFPFITGKNFTFRILVEIITGLWIILAIRDTNALPKMSKLFWSFAIFVAVIFISDLLSPNSLKSFWSNYERMEGWVTLAHLFALFVVTSSIMTKKLWQWLFRVSVGVSLIVFTFGSFQLVGNSEWFAAHAPKIYAYFHLHYPIHQGGVRLDATFGNATYLAIYMVFHIFLNFVLWSWAERGSLWKWFYGFAVISETFILYHTATRGAILGIIGGFFASALLILIFNRDNSRVRKGALGLVTGLVVLIGVFLLFKNSDFVKNSPVMTRFSELSFSDKTTESRFMIWNMAWQGFKERPILGWGQESFNYIFNKHYNPKMYSQEQWFDRTHNVFFDWLVAGGILGIISYLSLFVFALYYMWRRSAPFSFVEKSLLTGLFAAYFFHNLTVFDNITSYILFVLVLAYIQSYAGQSSEVLAGKVAALDSGTKNRVLIPLISVGMVFVLYAVNVPAMLAASELILALTPNQGGVGVNLGYYKKALSRHSFGDSEIHEQLFQTAAQASRVPTLDSKVKQEIFDFTNSEIKKQLESTPEDARYFLFAGSVMSSLGDSTTAITYLTKASELSPKKQTILFTLGSTYLSKGDLKSGTEVMKRAFELDQSFSEARMMYGIALIYSQQKVAAAEILKPIPSEFVLGDQRILQAYFGGGDYENALRSIDFFITKDPKNAEYYFSRAAIKYRMGRGNQAIEDLRKVVELNPSAKAQIDEFISKILSGQPL